MEVKQSVCDFSQLVSRKVTDSFSYPIRCAASLEVMWRKARQEGKDLFFHPSIPPGRCLLPGKASQAQIFRKSNDTPPWD